MPVTSGTAAGDERLIAAARTLMDMVNASFDGASCADRPCVLPEGVTWANMLSLAITHSLDAASWPYVQGRSDIPEKVRSAWERRSQLSLFRHVRMDAEREAVFAELDRAGIAYMPLRGTLIANYYPCPEMRTMSDNDFLYGYVECDGQGVYRGLGSNDTARARNAERAMLAVRDVFAGRGYEVKNLRGGNHDSYHKEPCYNFEPHRHLITPTGPHGFYYENPWRLAKPVHEGGLRFAMDATDEYIYTVVHAYKHVVGSGLGLRIVADVRAFWACRGDAMDEGRLVHELDVLGLVEFERALRWLAQDGPQACEECDSAKNLFEYLARCGAYGTREQGIANRLSAVAGKAGPLGGPAGKVDARARVHYVLGRLVDREVIEASFPHASRVRLLLPALVVIRAVRGFARHPKRLARELGQVLRSR
ncbi:MAG: nucleotidyltransferase family protein [Coriobacteriaceae bacterium]|nr:nucleotidyltransferase family protein [Coriobacteriaceae bacterium]